MLNHWFEFTQVIPLINSGGFKKKRRGWNFRFQDPHNY